MTNVNGDHSEIPDNPQHFDYTATWELANISYDAKDKIEGNYPDDYEYFPDKNSFCITNDATSTQLILGKKALISNSSLQTIIVAFKGSKEFSDWTRNAIFALKKWKKPTPPSTNSEVENYKWSGKIRDHFISFYPLILFFMGVQAFVSWLDEKWNNRIFDPLFNQSADPFTLHAWYLFGLGVLLLLGLVTGATLIIDKMKLQNDEKNEPNIKWINLWQITLLLVSVFIFYLVNDRWIGWFFLWIIFLSIMLLCLQILGKRWADCGVPELIKPVRLLYLWYLVILFLGYEFSSPSPTILKWMYFNTFSVPNFSILAVLYSPAMIAIFSLILIVQPRVHYGFETSYQSIRTELHLLLEEIFDKDPVKGSMIVFTGHSLGGGEAILAGMDFAISYPRWKRNIFVLNFGSPRTGNIRFAYEMNKTFERKFFNRKSGRIERIVNDLDIVARIPFKWNFYQHVGRRRRIGETKRGGKWIQAWFSKEPAEDHGRGSYQKNLQNDGFID